MHKCKLADVQQRPRAPPRGCRSPPRVEHCMMACNSLCTICTNSRNYSAVSASHPTMFIHRNPARVSGDPESFMKGHSVSGSRANVHFDGPRGHIFSIPRRHQGQPPRYLPRQVPVQSSQLRYPSSASAVTSSRQMHMRARSSTPRYYQGIPCFFLGKGPIFLVRGQPPLSRDSSLQSFLSCASSTCKRRASVATKLLAKVSL